MVITAMRRKINTVELFNEDLHIQSLPPRTIESVMSQSGLQFTKTKVLTILSVRGMHHLYNVHICFGNVHPNNKEKSIL